MAPPGPTPRSNDPAGYRADDEGASVLASLVLPADVGLVRSTPVFTAESVPAGLLAAHRLAAAVWGLLHVEQGALAFVLEDGGSTRRLMVGQSQVIEPEVMHHVEPEAGVAFRVDFYR